MSSKSDEALGLVLVQLYSDPDHICTVARCVTKDSLRRQNVSNLVSIFEQLLDSDALCCLLQRLIRLEVLDLQSDVDFLREDSFLTKLLASYIRESKSVSQYMMNVLGTFVDESRDLLLDSEDAVAKERALATICFKLLNSVVKSLLYAPDTLRILFKQIVVAKAAVGETETKSLAYVIGRMYFLRMLVPAITLPDKYGYCSSELAAVLRPDLIKLAKMIITLTSNVLVDDKLDLNDDADIWKDQNMQLLLTLSTKENIAYIGDVLREFLTSLATIKDPERFEGVQSSYPFHQRGRERSGSAFIRPPTLEKPPKLPALKRKRSMLGRLPVLKRQRVAKEIQNFEETKNPLAITIPYDDGPLDLQLLSPNSRAKERYYREQVRRVALLKRSRARRIVRPTRKQAGAESSSTTTSIHSRKSSKPQTGRIPQVTETQPQFGSLSILSPRTRARAKDAQQAKPSLEAAARLPPAKLPELTPSSGVLLKKLEPTQRRWLSDYLVKQAHVFELVAPNLQKKMQRL